MGAILGKMTRPTLLPWSVQNGWTDRHAVWVVNSGGSKEGCVTWVASWQHLVNTIEPSVCGDAALWQITLTTSFSFDTVYRGFRSVWLFPNHVCLNQAPFFGSIAFLNCSSIVVRWRLCLPEIDDIFNHSILIMCAKNGHVMSRKCHYPYTGKTVT